MKVLLSFMAVMSLVVLTTACNRDNRSENGIQREEDIRSEDFRETDNYNRSVPVGEDEMELERDKLNMGPNKSSVTE